MKIQINTDIEKDDLIEFIYNSISYEDIIDFIKDLEKCYADWGVTENLYNYFSKEIKILKEEEKGEEDYEDERS